MIVGSVYNMTDITGDLCSDPKRFPGAFTHA